MKQIELNEQQVTILLQEISMALETKLLSETYKSILLGIIKKLEE